MKDNKTLSREIGLEIGTICGKHFLNLEHLHYGYWTEGLEVNLANLPQAQNKYTDFLLSNIPEGVQSILDVGCGAGHTARRLTDAGYRVDCVSPSSFLAQQARALLNGTSEIFECSFEQLTTDRHYDLVLFSESFQYIDPETAIKKTMSLLNPGGRLLICDIFKINGHEKSPIAGGHDLATFLSVMSASPFIAVKDIDITDETAPSRDIENRICKEVMEPVSNLLMTLLDSRYPMLSKFVQWKYKKKIDKMRHKYFNGDRSAETFKKFKSYRCLLYQMNGHSH